MLADFGSSFLDTCSDFAKKNAPHEFIVNSNEIEGRAPGNAVALVMTTHETSVANLGIALDEMEKLPIVKAKPVAMPIVLADKET